MNDDFDCVQDIAGQATCSPKSIWFLQQLEEVLPPDVFQDKRPQLFAQVTPSGPFEFRCPRHLVICNQVDNKGLAVLFLS